MFYYIMIGAGVLIGIAILLVLVLLIYSCTRKAPERRRKAKAVEETEVLDNSNVPNTIPLSDNI